MPSASVIMATREIHGCFASIRKPYRMSWMNVLMSEDYNSRATTSLTDRTGEFRNWTRPISKFPLLEAQRRCTRTQFFPLVVCSRYEDWTAAGRQKRVGAESPADAGSRADAGAAGS